MTERSSADGGLGDVAIRELVERLEAGRTDEARAALEDVLAAVGAGRLVDGAWLCLTHAVAAGTALRSGRIDALSEHASAALEAVPEELPWLVFRCGSLLQARFRFTGEPSARDDAVRVIGRCADRIDLPELAVPARALLGNVHLLEGLLHATVDRCDAALDLADATGLTETSAVSMAHQFQGYALIEWNRLEEAEACLLAAWERAGASGRGVRSGVARVMAETRAWLGDREGARVWLARLEEVVTEPMTLRNREWLHAVRTGVTLGSGELDALRDWLGAYDYRASTLAALDRPSVMARLHELSRVLELLEVLERWDDLCGVATVVAAHTTDRRRWFAAQAHAAAAVGLAASGRWDDADTHMADALAQGEPGSLARVYAGRSRHRVALLERVAAGGGPRSTMAVRVLDVARSETEHRPGLTDRQRSVLARLALGESNKSIARALGISVNTVRTHLRVIFQRLGVVSRTQAVARGRELGWIDSES